MASLIPWRGLFVLDSASGDGGNAINNDFISLVNWNPQNSWGQSSNPGHTDDQSENYYPGSMWYNTSATTPRLWLCRSNTVGSAVWDELLVNPSIYALLGGVSGGQTLNGGTVSGDSLTLSSTANATKGKILFGSLAAYDEANTRLGIGTASPAAKLQLTGNQTQAAWGTSGVGLRVDAATYTDSSGSGTLSNNVVHSLGTPTLVATNAVTYSSAATIYIAGPPTASTNVTITKKYALQVASGDSFLQGNLLVGSSVPTGAITVSQAVTNPSAPNYGTYSVYTSTITSNNSSVYTGVRGLGAASVSSGVSATAATACIGVWGVGQALGAGNVTGIIGLYGNPQNSGTGTVTNGYSMYAAAVNNGGGGTLTNSYGFYSENQANGSSLNAGFAGVVSSGTNKYNLYMSGSAVNYLAGYLGVGVTPVSTQVITVTPATATDKAIVVKGAASQSGDLAEFQNSSGTVLAAITSAGRLSFNATGTAPSNTTTPAAWLDITVGGTAYKLPLYS